MKASPCCYHVSENILRRRLRAQLVAVRHAPRSVLPFAIRYDAFFAAY